MRRIQKRGQPFFYPGGDTGCLLVHGFVSAPQEMADLGKALASRGHTVLGVRLPGHATHPRDMRQARWEDWFVTLEDGYHLLTNIVQRVVVMGLSLGGILGLYFSSLYPVQGIVTIATPYVTPPRPSLRWLEPLLPLLKGIAPLFPYLPKPPPLDYRDRQAARDHLTYHTLPTRAVAEVGELTRLMRVSLSKVTIPCLILHAREDGGVHPWNARMIYQSIGSKVKTLRWIPHSGHVVTLEPSRHLVYRTAADFADSFNLAKGG